MYVRKTVPAFLKDSMKNSRETWNKEMHHYRDLTGSHAKKYFVYQYREHSQHVSLTRYVFAPDLKESRCEVVGLADDRINSSSLVFTDQSVRIVPKVFYSLRTSPNCYP